MGLAQRFAGLGIEKRPWIGTEVTFQTVLKAGRTFLELLDRAVGSDKMSPVGRLAKGNATVG